MTIQKVALVTGSGKQRIGWHVAQSLAQRGYRLALHYRTSRTEAEENVAALVQHGVEATAFPADLGDEAAARGLVDKVVERFRRIDVLVNCAAIWERKSLEDVTAADVRRHFEANVLGTFVCSQQAGLAMVKQPEGGCIITLGDWATVRPYVHYAAYFASKGAVEAMTRCLAVELGTRNSRVRVNGVLPGPVMIPKDVPEAERRQAIEATLVKREGSPDNVAAAVLALIENEFITGAMLPVDGGRSIYAPECSSQGPQ